jgi:hypothetical protein
MSEKKYFGLFCPQHRIWLKDGDAASARILYYEDEKLMAAHWEQMRVEAEHFSATRHHLWEVTEIGKHRPVSPEELPPGSAVCAVPVNRFKDLAIRNPIYA